MQIRRPALILRALVVSAALGLSGTAQAQTTVDFSLVPGGPQTSYTESGITFTGADGGSFIGTNTPNGTRGLLHEGSPRSEMLALLPALGSMVSVDLGDFNADQDLIFLEIFDAANNSLGYTDLLLSAADESMHTLTLSASGIASARFGSRQPSINGSSVYVDNFKVHLEPAAVPEPASISLLLAGAVPFAVRFARRRRAK